MVKKKLIETHLKDTNFKNNLYLLCLKYVKVKNLKIDVEQSTKLDDDFVELIDPILELYIKSYTDYENSKKNTNDVANKYVLGLILLSGNFITSFLLINFTITNLDFTKKQMDLLLNEFILNVELQICNILSYLDLKK